MDLQGLKTGMYYLRTRPAANAIQFTVDTKAVKEARSKQQQQNTAENKENVRGKQQEEEEEAMLCSLNNREACLMCSS